MRTIKKSYTIYKFDGGKFMEKTESYVEYVKDFILQNLPEYEGREVYGCNLGYIITEGINVDGSVTYNKQAAIEYIKEWFDEAAEIYRYQMENCGQVSLNPFENPEGWMVCMIIEGVNNILGQCDVVEEFWNDETELTDEIIQKILVYVQKVEEIEF